MDGSYFRDKENRKFHDGTASFLQGPEGFCWVQRVLNNTKSSKGSGRLQMGPEGSRRVKKGPE